MNLTETPLNDGMWNCFCNHSSNLSDSTQDGTTLIGKGKEKQELDKSILHGLLSSKLTQMSLTERSNGVNDIHGISEVEESPETIRRGIESMNQALDSITLDDEAKLKAKYGHGDAPTSALTYYFRLALKKSSAYVEKMKVPCLRAEEYDSSKAAMRLVLFFQRKVELFGEDCLVRDLEFDDLGDDGQDAIRRGLFQVLPQRDRAGRPVVFGYGKLNSSLYSTDTVMRCLLYIFMSPAVNDIESQKRGIVVIGYGLGQREAVPGRPAAFIRNWKATPVRIAAYHMCIDTSMMTFPAYVLCSYLENHTISRIKVHTGTPLECIYNLMTYGISRELIPVDEDGSINLSSNQAMVKTLIHLENMRREQSQPRVPCGTSTNQQQQLPPCSNPSTSDASFPVIKEIEIDDESLWDPIPVGIENEDSDYDSIIKQETLSADIFSGVHLPQVDDLNVIPPEDDTVESDAKEIILVPSPMDIIMGKGRRPKSRPGSLRLHNLLLKYLDKYDDSTKNGKTELTSAILDDMKKAGSRFLTLAPAFDTGGANDGSLYVECDDATARERIAHGFRNIRSRSRKKDRVVAANDNKSNANKKRTNEDVIDHETGPVVTTSAFRPKDGTVIKGFIQPPYDKDCTMKYFASNWNDQHHTTMQIPTNYNDHLRGGLPRFRI